MSAKSGGKKTWQVERRKRAAGYRKLQKEQPAGGGSKYAKKKERK